MIRDLLPEERVIWRKRFHAQYFDFRGKSRFTRFDGCEFVKCKLLIDQDTEQLAFTGCVFKDCNIDRLEQNEERGLYDEDNFFDRPLEERRVDFEKRLAQALADRARDNVRAQHDRASKGNTTRCDPIELYTFCLGLPVRLWVPR